MRVSKTYRNEYSINVSIYDWMISKKIVENYPELRIVVLVRNSLYKYVSKDNGHHFR